MEGRLTVGLVVCLVGSIGSPTPISAQLPPVAFEGVSVVTMARDGEVLPGQTVVVRDGRIAAMGPSAEMSVPEDATVINAAGQYLAPGLWDMHVHVSVPFEDGPLYLRSGVTSVLNLGTLTPGDIKAESVRSRDPMFLGPTLYTAGPIIQGGESPQEVEDLVRLSAREQFDVVKVHGDLSERAFQALEETASSLAVRVTGHAQRRRGIAPVYRAGQDLAHVEEYLYTFNPREGVLGRLRSAVIVALMALPLTTLLFKLFHRWTEARALNEPSYWSRQQERLYRFSLIAWGVFGVLALTLTSPFPGLLSSSLAAVAGSSVLAALVAYQGVVLVRHCIDEARLAVATFPERVASLLLALTVGVFVVGVVALASRAWLTTDFGLRRIASATATAGITVTPNLVAWDYLVRQSGKEFNLLMRRPGVRYLRPETRDAWLRSNAARQGPASLMWTQEPVRRAYGRLLSRLTGSLHAAGVPLLAGSDVGAHGVLPGESLPEELALLVEAGLTPFEALETATTNAAEYLGVDRAGRISVGFQADLLLLEGDPLQDIEALKSPVGVMRRGRWMASADFADALAQLESQRR